MANFIDNSPQDKVKLLLCFVGNQDLTEEDYELMEKVIVKQKTINNVKAKKGTTFEYPQKHYTIKPDIEISIKPECDGTFLTYSITPNLPEGLKLNEETGEIYGKAIKETGIKKYEIKCENIYSKLQFTLSIEVFDYKFRTDCTGCGIEIRRNDMQAYKTSNGDWNGHAYVNVEMKKGIYRIKYKHHGDKSNNNQIYVGATPNKNYNSSSLYGQSNTNSISIYTGSSSCCCRYGSVVNQPGITNHIGGSEYELIFDMDKKEFSLIHDDKETLLMKGIPDVLYPFFEILYSGVYIELLSVVHEEE